MYTFIVSKTLAKTDGENILNKPYTKILILKHSPFVLSLKIKKFFSSHKSQSTRNMPTVVE